MDRGVCILQVCLLNTKGLFFGEELKSFRNMPYLI